MVNRPTDDEQGTLFVPIAGQSFESKQDWIARASRVLTAHPEYHDTEHDGPAKGWRGNHFTAICYDQKGRRVRNGGDFQRAADDDAYPVWWIWPDQIAAMLRSCKGRARVKPLVWGYHPAGKIAAPPTGHAYIIDTRTKGRCYSIKGFSPERQFDSLDEAKAAAKADYEARILAALDPAPDQEEWDAAIEAAAKVAKKIADQYVGYMSRVERSIRNLKKGPRHD